MYKAHDLLHTPQCGIWELAQNAYIRRLHAWGRARPMELAGNTRLDTKRTTLSGPDGMCVMVVVHELANGN